MLRLAGGTARLRTPGGVPTHGQRHFLAEAVRFSCSAPLQLARHRPLALAAFRHIRQGEKDGGRAWARAQVLPHGWITMPQCGGECLDTASWERGPRCGCATLSNLPLKSEFWIWAGQEAGRWTLRNASDASACSTSLCGLTGPLPLSI